MELAVLALFIVIYTEMREHRHKQLWDRMSEDCRKLRLGEHIMSRRLQSQDNAISKLEATIKDMASKLDKQSQFIDKAHTDLATIVQEYEVNGIPLGYDRKGEKVAQFYEVGL